MINELIDPDIICLNLQSQNKKDVLKELVVLLKQANRINNEEVFLQDILAREALGNTGFEMGIAIPHAKSYAVNKPSIVIGISQSGIDYGAEDGLPSKFFFMIASPEKNANLHIEMLAQLSSKLIEPQFTAQLLHATSKHAVITLLSTTEKQSQIFTPKINGFLIGVTGCPTGIAHTYLAAEALETSAAQLGYDIKVETNGSIGIKNSPSDDDIARAQAIIVASDKQVDITRFAGKRLIQTGVKAPIKDAKQVIQQAMGAPVYHPTNTANSRDKLQSTNQSAIHHSTGNKSTNGGSLYRYLMNGVSHMIPFVVTGGLLIALALAVGGEPTAQGMQIPVGSVWNKVLDVGAISFKLMIPVLAGYIAYAIADRPALAPGLIGGWIANNGEFYGAQAGTGFIGAIIAGLLVGYFIKWLVSFNFHKYLRPLVPIMIAPILGSLYISAWFIFVIGAPIASLMESLNTLLTSMSGGNLILLGIVLGGMAGFDMGGPFNKVAFLFSVGMITNGQTQFMGAMACAIPVAPLGMAIATFIGKKMNVFQASEIEAGKAAGAMGLVGISEGAIPFAAQDPFAVIPANVIGSMAAAVMAFLFGVSNRVAHGGPVVALLGAMNKPIIALLCMFVGALVTALVCLTLKKLNVTKKQTE